MIQTSMLRLMGSAAAAAAATATTTAAAAGCHGVVRRALWDRNGPSHQSLHSAAAASPLDSMSDSPATDYGDTSTFVKEVGRRCADDHPTADAAAFAIAAF